MTEDNKRTADDDRIEPDRVDEVSRQSGPESKFVSPGLFLFLDYLAISVGSWLYWIVISKFASVNEIGVATTVYSLVLLVSFITQLGMEYPLLRRSKYDGGRALGVALLIEIMIATAALPIILIVTDVIFGGTIQDLLWIGIVLLLLLSIEFVFRFFLLGSSDSKTVLITDSIGLSIKFLSGYYLVSVGYGAYGILTAYLLEVICIIFIYFLVMNRRLSPRLSSLKYLLDFFKSALINAPSKYSGQIIASLSVVMLASYGLDSSDVGLFYMALLISVFIGSFASSMAFMVIPASSYSNRDLSSESIRISLGLISPIVVILLVGPNLVLSLIGPQYEVAAVLLFTLGIGILPYAVTINVISKLNNLNKSKELLLLGLIQIFVFLGSFAFFVPLLGTSGAAYSILLSFITTSVFGMRQLPKLSLRHIVICYLAVVVATSIGYLINYYNIINPLPVVMLSSVTICIVIILKFRIISVTEVTQLFRGISLRG